jgi:hypothetical protein
MPCSPRTSSGACDVEREYSDDRGEGGGLDSHTHLFYFIFGSLAQFTRQLTLLLQPLHVRRELFISLDTSGDGYLSFKELLDGLNSVDVDWEKLDCDR